MTVQATGAMALVVADVPAVHDVADPARALFTLSILTGIVMLLAGLFKLGAALRFVSNAVMVGFINAVGVNIVLGQLDNLTGYDAEGPNRVWRALDTLLHPGQFHVQTLVIGLATIALIIVAEKTPLGALGMVVAVAITSALASVVGWDGVARLSDLANIPNSLPRPTAPLLERDPRPHRPGGCTCVRRTCPGCGHLGQLP